MGEIMRTEIIERKLCTFEELPEDIQEKAIEKLWDINVNFDWWENVYEDAETIGLKISEFDLDRASYVKGAFLQSAYDVAQAIIKEHGPHCETVKTAENYLAAKAEFIQAEKLEHSQLFADDLCRVDKDHFIWNGLIYGANYLDDEDIDTEEIDDEFLRSLCEDYRIILQKEYEYLTSEEAIKKTILANEYEFDEEGNIA